MKCPFIWRLAVLGLTVCTITASADPVSPVTQAKNSRLDWWRDAKFGMFIHWGIFAIPGRGEWVQWNEQIPCDQYAKLADQFNPTNFTPATWAALAKSAGMKYMVLTSRHHDGFALFDDGTNTFTATHSAAHRDFVAEYVKAVRDAGLRVGLYYSPLDWRFPGYILPDIQRQSANAMRDQYHRQMKELLSNYGKIDVLWFDGGETDWLSFGGKWQGAQWVKRATDADHKGVYLEHYKGGFSWQHDQVYKMLRQLQPDIVINGRADMPEDFHSREGWGALGDFDNQHAWELCVPMAGAWGYSVNAKVKPLADYIQLLVKVVGRDGNLLMNVGPDRNGKVDDEQVSILHEIGAWLDKYGDSIYSTRGGPFLPADWGVSTYRDQTIYLHVLKWAGEKITLPHIPSKILKARALTGGNVQFSQTDGGIEISLPAASQDPIDTIIALELDSPAKAISPVK